MARAGYGKKDGTKKGLKQGGKGRNKTTPCRKTTKKK